MSVDSVSNMLSSIKNASMTQKFSLELPYARVKEEVAKVLKEKGFLENVRVFKEKGSSYKMLHLDIANIEGVSKITDLKRVSKPGRRVYKSFKDIRPVLNGYGVAVVSTSKGILSDDDVRKRRLGGEVICEVW